MDDKVLSALSNDPVGLDHKGLAPTLSGTTPADLAARPRSVREAGFTFPLMVLRRSAVEHNVAVMSDYCHRRGVLLAPHGKTTMSPELHARQLDAGAWGLTAATVHQVAVYRSFGVQRVLLANELVDRVAISWVVDELERDPGFDFYCYVDSSEGIALLAEAVAHASPRRRMSVLVEVGHEGGRAGCRGIDSVLAVARGVAAEPRLRLAGIAGFEGLLGHDAEPGTLRQVDAFVDSLREAAETVLDAGLRDGPEPFLVSAGTSSYFDRVAERLDPGWSRQRGVAVVLRSGSYVAHDHGLYETVSPFAREAWSPGPLEPAICTWAHVLSRPEPGLAIVGAGRRDLPFDSGLPRPLWVWPSAEVSPRPLRDVATVDLNDHHAFLRQTHEPGLRVGDLVGFGISHPCTAFDKWRLIPLVDDEWMVVGGVHTYF